MKKTLFLTTLIFLTQATPALAASLYFSPASGTYAKGSTLRVNIGINTGGEGINAVQANFSYPADKLQFTSLSTSGSALTIIAERTGGGGFVKLAGGTPNPGFSGSKHLGSAYFKVLANTSSASLTFMGDSAVLRNSNNQNVLSGRGSANFTFSASLPSPTPAAPLQVSNVSASPSADHVTISWATDIPSTSTVEYGLDTRYGLATSSAQPSTDHQLTLTLFLLPGITYHYQVKSTGSAGIEATSPDLTFTIPGSTPAPSPSSSVQLPLPTNQNWLFVAGLAAIAVLTTTLSLILLLLKRLKK